MQGCVSYTSAYFFVMPSIVNIGQIQTDHKNSQQISIGCQSIFWNI